MKSTKTKSLVAQKRLLAHYWQYKLLSGNQKDPVVVERSLEWDRRKLPAVLKALSEQGYITRVKTNPAIITSKAYDELEIFDPNIGFKSAAKADWSGKRWSHDCHYTADSFSLTLEERKFILEHKERFLFVLVDIYSGEEELFELEKYNTVRTYALYVQTAEFLQDRALYQAKQKLEEITGNNLAWGINELVQPDIVTNDIDRVFSTYFSQEYNEKIILGHCSRRIGKNPDKWEAEILDKFEKLNREREAISRDIYVIDAVLQKIEKQGGWEKFLEHYRAAILLSSGPLLPPAASLKKEST